MNKKNFFENNREIKYKRVVLSTRLFIIIHNNQNIHQNQLQTRRRYVKTKAQLLKLLYKCQQILR